MYYYNHVNNEFTHYLNRYFTGIALLKDKIESIALKYELSEAFSTYACRLIIDVVINYQNLPPNERTLVNKYFYNNMNSTGSSFVAFYYKPKNSHHINIKEIKSFIHHYEFAQSLFDGFVKKIIPDTCSLKITCLDDDPFFNYAGLYLNRFGEDYDEANSFEKMYKEVTGQDFNFDNRYHHVLIEAATKGPFEREETMTDRELNHAEGGSLTAIRRFVMDKQVQFYTQQTKVIEAIFIDIQSLKKALNDYQAQRFYDEIAPMNILKYINQKEQEENKLKNAIQEKSAALNVSIGDYISVGQGKPEIGIVKSLDLSYNKKDLIIIYNVLKKDLSESRLPLKSTSKDELFTVLRKEVFEQEGPFLNPSQLLDTISSKGIPNPFIKKTKSKS